MSQTMMRWRSRLGWMVPVVALSVLLGFELGWGRQMHRLPEPGAVPEAKPVTPALLPEYTVAGGLAGRVETVTRTLFNPTRRPAPTAVAADTGRPQIVRGQFVLTGTSLAGERSIAFLKEVAGGKSRSVRQGEQINGMLVAEVKPDRVRLTVGSDSEELVLKVATGRRTTAAPTPAAPNAIFGMPGAPSGVPPEAVLLMEQRRRAAQAATAAETAPNETFPASRRPLLPTTPPPPAGQAAASSDPAWNEVYERMRARTQPTK